MGGSVRPTGWDGGDGAADPVLCPHHPHPAVSGHPGCPLLPPHPGEEEGGRYRPAQRQDGAGHWLRHRYLVFIIIRISGYLPCS